MPEDFMELGDSGLVPLEDGWFLDTTTGNRVAPDGTVISPQGDIISKPEDKDV